MLGTRPLATRPLTAPATTVVLGPANIKTKNGVAITSIKTFEGVVTASVKSVNGLT